MKNIYIVTSGEIKHKAQELCTLLEKHGFNITFKWWLSYTQNGNNEYHQMSPKQFKEIDKIQVMTDKNAIRKVNELEWVEGKIYANTYQFNKEVGIIIDPKSGSVEGVIDFSGLKSKVEQVPNLDVLNGIAYHRERKTFFVTGKNWSKLFEVKILPKK